MGNYIDRDLLVNMLCEKCNNVTGGKCDLEKQNCVLVGAVRNLPAADVAPVARGRWLAWSEKFPDYAKANKKILGVFCTKCNRHADDKTNYCPHCGAKMYFGGGGSADNNVNG